MGKHSSVLFRARDYLHPKYWPMWFTFGALRLAALLPYRSALALGRLLGRLLSLLSRSRHQVIDTNLVRCFPEKSATELKSMRTAFFRNLGISLMEVAMCWWWSDARLKPLVEIRGRENLDSVIASGRGAILLTGHYTSLEIGGRLL